MRAETINFVNRIKNYELKRNYDEDEFTFQKRYYKSRLNSCYGYLKLLSSKMNGSGKLNDDYAEVMKLSKECEQEFLRWKEKYENT